MRLNRPPVQPAKEACGGIPFLQRLAFGAPLGLRRGDAHGRFPYDRRLAEGEIRIYVWREGANVALWHEADLRLAAPEGRFTGGLPTFGAECLRSGALQTWHRGVAKVGT